MAFVHVGAPAQSNNLAPSGHQQPQLTSSLTGAATAISATLAALVNGFTYITGFQVTGAGATAASVITITLTGVQNTLSFKLVIPAGVTTSITPLIVTFPVPLAGLAINTALVVNVPSFGAGNTDAAVAAQGFQQIF